MYFVYKIWKILIFRLKHIMHASVHNKIYQSKHYSVFIQSGYKASFTFSLAEIWDFHHFCEQNT